MKKTRLKSRIRQPDGITSVKLSSKNQVVIPKRVREYLHIASGTEFMIIPYKGMMEFIPMEDVKDLEGAFPGIDTTIIREPDREL